jgi:fused signal recognition particle receptor
MQGTLGRLWGTKGSPEPVPPVEADVKPGVLSGARPGSWVDRLKQGLGKTSARLSDGITGLFTKRKLEAATLDELEDLLIESDLGVDTAENIIAALRKGRFDKGLDADDVRAVLKGEVERVLVPVARPLSVDKARKPHVILVVGVNGTGKTTTIGKLAARLRREGNSVMLAAADTFRAAAIDQLGIWGERTGAIVVSGAAGSDAAGLSMTH